MAAVAATIAVVLLAALLVDGPVSGWALTVHESDGVLAYHAFAKHLGRAPAALAALLICVVGLCIRRSRAWGRALLYVTAVLAASLASSHLLKVILARPRPTVRHLTVSWSEAIARPEHMLDGSYHSLPSGDVTLAAALAMMGWLFAGRGRVRWLLWLLPAASAVDRVLHASHYPSDTLAGCAVGIGVAVLLWRWLRPVREADQPDSTGGTHEPGSPRDA